MNDLDENPFWVEFPADKKIPKNAIIAGNYNGSPIYIGRAMHNNAMTPGSVIASDGLLYHTWGFKTYVKTEFEILIGGSSLNWVPTEGDQIPMNAFVGGWSQDSEDLYIARVKHEGNILVGKVHPQYHLSYMPDIEGMKEIENGKYEIFVI